MFTTSFVQGLTEVSTVAKQRLGTLRWEDNKCYKYVQYKEGAAAVDGVAGEATYYYAGGADPAGYTINQVTSDLSDSAELGAGILQVAMSDNEYGWVQIKGPATLSLALTAGADGDPLTPTGAGDGTLDAVDTTSAATANVHKCAYADDASLNKIICDFPY